MPKPPPAKACEGSRSSIQRRKSIGDVSASLLLCTSLSRLSHSHTISQSSRRTCSLDMVRQSLRSLCERRKHPTFFHTTTTNNASEHCSGTVVAQHNGNQQFRHLVSLVKDRFVGTTVRREKRMIAMSIIQTIQTLTPPGRFLVATDDMRGGLAMGHQHDCGESVHPLILQKTWILADRDKALSKVLHRLRDKNSRFSRNESTCSAEAGPLGMPKPSTNEEDKAKLLHLDDMRQSADLSLLSASSPNTPVFNSLDREELALLVSFRQTRREEERRKEDFAKRKAGPEENNFESEKSASSHAPTEGGPSFFLMPPEHGRQKSPLGSDSTLKSNSS